MLNDENEADVLSFRYCSGVYKTLRGKKLSEELMFNPLYYKEKEKPCEL